MAKNMARIDENGSVINVEWCSGTTLDSDTLKYCDGLAVQIGDTYSEGKFYRDGEEITSDFEALQKKIAELEAQNAILRQEASANSILLDTYRSSMN